MAQLRAGAGAEHQRNAPSSAAIRGHQDRAEAQQARLVDRLARRLAVDTLRPPARKSIIMMAFFLTMPISSTMPMMAMNVELAADTSSASSAPTLAEGKVDRMVIGWTKLSYSTPSTM